MTPRILALDLSLTATGVCLDGECRLLKCKAKGAERLAIIEGVLTEYMPEAELVVVEGYSYASPYQAHQVGELGGVVRVLVWSHRKPLVVVQPKSLKAFATGKGNANKDAMIAAAIRRFGFQGETNDEADAYLLWCMARQAYGDPVVEVPQVARQAVAAVEWPEMALS